jgi:hypothetical protein
VNSTGHYATLWLALNKTSLLELPTAFRRLKTGHQSFVYMDPIFRNLQTPGRLITFRSGGGRVRDKIFSASQNKEKQSYSLTLLQNGNWKL